MKRVIYRFLVWIGFRSNENIEQQFKLFNARIDAQNKLISSLVGQSTSKETVKIVEDPRVLDLIDKLTELSIRLDKVEKAEPKPTIEQQLMKPKPQIRPKPVVVQTKQTRVVGE